MDAKHTPGPWELVSLSGYGAPFSIRMAYQSADPKAPKTYYGVQSVRRREDARLISAAPELLELIERAHEADCPDEDIRTAWWEARAAAIAKATGAA